MCMLVHRLQAPNQALYFSHFQQSLSIQNAGSYISQPFFLTHLKLPHHIQSQSHSAVQSGAEYFAYIHQSILLFLLYRVTSALKTLDIPFRHPPYSYSFPRTTKTVLNIVAISLKNENFLMFSRLYFILPGRTSSI